MFRFQNDQIHKFVNYLTHPRVFFYTLIWLMVLLVVGTIDQRYIGLYQSQMKYFSSYIWWVGGIPTPGGYPTMAVVFINLTAKLLYRNNWGRNKLGVNITHLGAILLLVGGFLTAAFSYEGGMVIEEGSSSNFVSDYHNVEFVVRETTNQKYDELTTFGPDWIQAGKKLPKQELPFEIEIVNYCENCKIVRRQIVPDEDTRGFARMFRLDASPLEVESEKNIPGVNFRVRGVDATANGLYSIFDNMAVEQKMRVGNRTFVFEIRKEQRPLPFRIELIDFEKLVYPGTNKPSSYKSIVNLYDGNLKQRVVIQMNEPLRYKGYTFYQASFFEGTNNETTVLAVVDNVGRLFPYISSIIMCFGLLIHLLLQTPKLFKQREKIA